MGPSTQSVGELCDRMDQPDQVHSAQPAAAAGGTGASSSPPQLQYWYSRAHRALKQRASEPAQLLREYQHITALDASIGHGVGVARSRAAAGRNRYGNVLPYDHNRVVLLLQQQQQQAGKEPPSSYINASSVTFSTPSLPAPCAYIATQGPLPATMADFWAMVWEQRVPAIVMLTNCAEAGMVKCSQYFPDTPGAVSRVGGYEIQVAQQAPFGPDCILRTLQLSRTGDSATQHTVSHYHFTTWPDHGTPDSSSGIQALCRALGPARASGRPILVHCSAGIGRTGTFCAIDILLQRLDAWAAMRGRSSSGSGGSRGGDCGSSGSSGSSGPDRAEVEDTLDVPALVHKLRAQRMGMVQTLEQYVFVYKALIDDLAARLKGGGSSSSGGGSTTAPVASSAGGSI